MAIKPYLRLATWNVPIYFEIVVINGKQKLKSLKVYTNVFELFERAGFNVSLVAVNERTTGIADENGTYNGLYGAVQSGKADTSIFNAPLRIAESIGQPTPVIADAENVIATKREPAQVFDGTLYDCLTTLGPLNNLLLVAIAAVILIFLSLLVSKRASWNFFAQLMTENFVPFRPLSLQLTFMTALFMVRALFCSAYSTDVTVANPSRLINSLEDLTRSNLLPSWVNGTPLYLEFKQGVTKAHAKVFNMGPKNRSKVISIYQLQSKDHSKLIETNAALYTELFTSTIAKYACRYKSTEICSGSLRMFISKPFSRTSWVYAYSKNTPALTAYKLKEYANKFLEQSLHGNTFKTATDEYFAPSPQCENEIRKGFEATEATNRVGAKLVPWRETLSGLVVSMAVLFGEILFAIMTFLFSVRQYFWI